MSEKPDMNDFDCPAEDHPDREFWIRTIWETWLENTCASDDAKQFIHESWMAGRLRLIVDTNILREKYYAAGGEFFSV
jgi:hypothetical protein